MLNNLNNSLPTAIIEYQQRKIIDLINESAGLFHLLKTNASLMFKGKVNDENHPFSLN